MMQPDFIKISMIHYLVEATQEAVIIKPMLASPNNLMAA
jgi:hypothetical protein